MSFPRPRSLNGLILVGFVLISLPLAIAVLWALNNLDELAGQSEQLVVLGVSATENNRVLAEQVQALERVSRQYLVLEDPESLQLMGQDLERLEATLDQMQLLVSQADAGALANSIRVVAQRVIEQLQANPANSPEAIAAVAEFPELSQQVDRLAGKISIHIDNKLNALEESARAAQRTSAWQAAALIPGTILIGLFFTLLVAKPIRQIDMAISQLGDGGISRPIIIKGPTDLEALGRQLEWLRVRLIELAQEKNRFLRHMSHELKTPLANIREGTELLLDGAVGELVPPQREVTGILRSNGLKLQNLIENLLSFSAWQSKNELLMLSEFSLRELVLEVTEAHKLSLKSAHIQLHLDVEEMVVSADRDKLRTVIDNLLSNAAKFTPRRGRIHVRARAAEKSFVLEVADTGPGIPEEEKARIFEAFYQGPTVQGGHVAGTGIGLSVVLECVQAHDGSVELLTGQEFSGAHFRVHIPQEHIELQQQIAANG